MHAPPRQTPETTTCPAHEACARNTQVVTIRRAEAPCLRMKHSSGGMGAQRSTRSAHETLKPEQTTRRSNWSARETLQRGKG
eukprot:4491392-Alexandrium_andersonii.AAC.1